jgi:hypothetical protein
MLTSSPCKGRLDLPVFPPQLLNETTTAAGTNVTSHLFYISWLRPPRFFGIFTRIAIHARPLSYGPNRHRGRVRPFSRAVPTRGPHAGYPNEPLLCLGTGASNIRRNSVSNRLTFCGRRFSSSIQPLVSFDPGRARYSTSSTYYRRLQRR